MKVIGHTSHTVLVEATPDELAKITGVAGAWELGRRYAGEARDYFPAGGEINVSLLWKVIEAERGRPEQIERTAKSLEGTAALLRSINESLQPVITQEIAAP